MEMGVPCWYLLRSVRSVTRRGVGEEGPEYTTLSGCMEAIPLCPIIPRTHTSMHEILIHEGLDRF